MLFNNDNNDVPQFIRVGIVSSVDKQACTARVYFEDLDSYVSSELRVIVKNAMSRKDFWLPEVDEQVLCIFLPNDESTGFIIGSFYSETDKPPTSDGSIGYWVDEQNYIKWAPETRKFVIRAENSIEWVVPVE